MRVIIRLKKGELQKATTAYKRAAEAAWKRVIDNVLIDLHTLSPVDTGLLRNSYLLGKNNPPANPGWDDVSQTHDIQSVRAKLYGYKGVIQDTVFLTNYQPYQTQLNEYYYPNYFYNIATKEANRHRLGLR